MITNFSSIMDTFLRTGLLKQIGQNTASIDNTNKNLEKVNTKTINVPTVFNSRYFGPLGSDNVGPVTKEQHEMNKEDEYYYSSGQAEADQESFDQMMQEEVAATQAAQSAMQKRQMTNRANKESVPRRQEDLNARKYSRDLPKYGGLKNGTEE